MFGELLDQITDQALRAKTVNAWLEGCRRGGWESVDQLKKMPFTLLTDTHGVNFIEHTIAVTKGAIGLAKAQMDAYANPPIKINMDRLIIGGLLHDVGKLLEIEPDGQGGYRKSHAGKCMRHPISGAVLAKEVGLSDEIANTTSSRISAGSRLGRPSMVNRVSTVTTLENSDTKSKLSRPSIPLSTRSATAIEGSTMCARFFLANAA